MDVGFSLFMSAPRGNAELNSGEGGIGEAGKLTKQVDSHVSSDRVRTKVRSFACRSDNRKYVKKVYCLTLLIYIGIEPSLKRSSGRLWELQPHVQGKTDRQVLSSHRNRISVRFLTNITSRLRRNGSNYFVHVYLGIGCEERLRRRR